MQHAFLRIIYIVAFFASCLSYERAVASTVERPNFIVINIDDLGYGDIGPYGSTLNRTPNLDRMAEEGRRLTCFYAAPVCSPSRASLMTGCYPKRALSIPHVLFPADPMGLHPDEVTVAELLSATGYATGIIGKWHLGDQPEFLPTRQGFDYYFGLPYSNDMGPAADGVKSNLGEPLPKLKGNRANQPPLPLMRNETVLKRVLPQDQRKLVENYTNEAVSFIWNHRDEPFFLYLPHSAVHFPLYPGEAFHNQSSNGLFGDWVEEVDWSVGQVLQTLRDLGLDERTLVLFTSDNGGQPRHGAVNAPLRGGKGSTFEGGVRVPTIAWWPGNIPADTEIAAVTSMMDILPTFTKLAGGKVPTDRTIDGGDIWPILAGAADAESPHEEFYYYRGLKLEAVRSGPWKLFLKSGELYNLDSDIGESQNVAEAHPEIVARIRKLASAIDSDLGTEAIGPGCRALGRVNKAEPLISRNGKVREGFSPSSPQAAMGIMIGELSATTALAQVRLNKNDPIVDSDASGAAGVVRFVLYATEDDAMPVAEKTAKAEAEHDFIARLAFEGLEPGTTYVLKTQVGQDENSFHPGPTAEFTTLPGRDSDKAVRFVVVTGMNYAKFHGDNRIDRRQHRIQNNTDLPQAYSGPDKHLGYPALDTIRKLQPHFFVGTGDNVYYDTPTKPRAQTPAELRKKWHEQFIQPRYREMFAVVPTYWMIDDHDFRVDDCDLTGDYAPSPELGRQMMLEQLPVTPREDDDAKTYRTHRVNRDLQVWFPENRMYRSPNAMADGPDKSIWGTEQKKWLYRTLAESDATFKLLISPTPMIGPDDKRKTDNHADIGGFQHERDEFFAWLAESGLDQQNFYLVCGDRHWQYHSIHPTGIEEFSSGALVDANARLGRLPGDPQSTDPEGLIKVPYTQQNPSGGFLMIEVNPATEDETATLSFTFHDEHGAVLHKHRKLAAD
ncbi:unnamed protein product [Cladocopium goreaui]|uniref:Arylsulfatase A (ASA) (Cerebroside-sulfatase) n=1 Tax=Cladocopium goreaui TaxID=2562237 RepID=A0A9P1FCD6_9DINO|nr:unnamed protein product [Cladocopium goreaui]